MSPQSEGKKQALATRYQSSHILIQYSVWYHHWQAEISKEGHRGILVPIAGAGM
jgi:hypothetical protein